MFGFRNRPECPEVSTVPRLKFFFMAFQCGCRCTGRDLFARLDDMAATFADHNAPVETIGKDFLTIVPEKDCETLLVGPLPCGKHSAPEDRNPDDYTKSDIGHFDKETSFGGLGRVLLTRHGLNLLRYHPSLLEMFWDTTT